MHIYTYIILYIIHENFQLAGKLYNIMHIYIFITIKFPESWQARARIVNKLYFKVRKTNFQRCVTSSAHLYCTHTMHEYCVVYYRAALTTKCMQEKN